MIGFDAGEWEGLDNLGEDALNELRGESEAKVVDAVLLFANELRLTLTGQRSGRTYRVSKTGRLHIASAPGEPPAVLFDNLRLSVGHSWPTWDGWTVSAEAGVGLGKPPDPGEPDPETSYARRLEFGGFDSRGIYIARRPYMGPTDDRTRERIEKILGGS